MTTMGGKYKLSFIEKCFLTLICIFQSWMIIYSVRMDSFVWRKFNAYNFEKILNRAGSTATILAYIKHYVPIKDIIEELKQIDKLFLIISPKKSPKKLSYTVLRTWRLYLVFYFALAIYGSLHCAERFSNSGKVWSPFNLLESNINVLRLCGTKLVAIFELNFVLYAFVDFTCLIKNRLQLLNRLIVLRCNQSKRRTPAYHKVMISDHDVSTILLVYTKLQRIQRRLLHCFRIPILLFYSNNVYSLIFVTLTAYNQYFMTSSASKHAKTCEFLLRTAICYSVILVCVLCRREADQVAVNMQSCTSASSSVHFFHLELSDRKFKFEIFRFFTLDFETFLSMMGFISTYIVILVQFKIDTIPQSET